MKEKLKKYLSKREIVILLIAIVTTLASLSYAFFISTDIFNNNIATTECFKLTLVDSNDINLDKTYPLSESEGSSLTPYTFTIKNVCNKVADYQVNIETLNTSSLDTNYLRIKLDNNESSILKSHELNETNINQNVKEGRKITTGTLRADEERTYNLRMWIDEDATVEQSSNKEYHGKVTVQATPNHEVNDLEIAYIVDGVQQDAPPAKGTGYKLKSYECTNADVSWDNKGWGLYVNNMTGRVKCNLEFETATSVNVTMYGAANAEITYTDATGTHTETLDSTGKKENVEIGITNDIVFTDTTVAKDPDNLSNNYTKSISINEETTDVYVMPDNALYWYGYDSGALEDANSANGWLTYSNRTPVYNTNNIRFNPGSGEYYSYLGIKDMVSVGKTVKAICDSAGSSSGRSGWFFRVNPKSAYDAYSTQIISVQSSSPVKKEMTLADDGYIGFGGQNGDTLTLYALWIE